MLMLRRVYGRIVEPNGFVNVDVIHNNQHTFTVVTDIVRYTQYKP